MSPPAAGRVGYVVKRYPRYSETFIVNELLAHEDAGMEVEIFSLRPPIDTHFQESIARVRAPVTYLHAEGLRAADLWSAIEAAAQLDPSVWMHLRAASGEEARTVYQGARLAREVARRDIRHLHAHFATDAAAVARLAARFAGIPYSLTAHAKDIFHQDVRPDDLRRKMEEASSVVTVSDYNAAFLRGAYGEAARRVERIYNGIDLQQCRYRSPDDRPPLITAVGRLVEKKGFSILVEACALLAGRGLRFECRIIGAGELADSLRMQIRQLHLEARVTLTGPLPQSLVYAAIQESAVFAAPCVTGADGDRDGLPTVLLEAMALGTPCVSTDVTGIPEVLWDEETGLHASQHDPEALAAATERLLTDRPLRVRLSERARRLVMQEFDIRRNTSRLRELFASSPGAAAEYTSAAASQ